MASGHSEHIPVQIGRPAIGREETAWDVIKKILAPIASLKLTVALFAMALFVIFVGTLAQDKMEIWRAVDVYFHALWITIPLNVFFPSEWFPDMQNVKGFIWFPGGKLIGYVMFVNLLAAHTVRFKAQARGSRLTVGLAVIGFGSLVTLAVILSGHNSEGLQGEPDFEWLTLWNYIRVGLVALFLASVFATACVFVKLDRDRVVERVAMLFINAVVLTLVICLWLVSPTDAGLRIAWQGIQGSIAGLVLLGGCIIVFKKRAGIVLLHTGVMLLMLNELIVAHYNVEERMSFFEGETANYAVDIRAVELAVIDRSGDDEKVMAVPFAHHGSLTRHVEDGRVLKHPSLPFGVQVLKYLENSSDLRALKDGESTLATHGMGRYQTVDDFVSVAGADVGGEVNQCSAFVRFTNKKTGKDLGAFLLSQWAYESPEIITVDGRKYELYLRFKRQYKDYSITLVETGRDEYVGTDTPRNFYSRINLVDAKRGIHIKNKKIWMNNPMRYAGETFYQSGHNFIGGKEYSTLQVVKNRGWMIPYVACGIVAIGMLAHFWFVMVRFLKRVSTNPTVNWGVVATGMNAVTGFFESITGIKAESKDESAPDAPPKKPPKPRPGRPPRIQEPELARVVTDWQSHHSLPMLTIASFVLAGLSLLAAIGILGKGIDLLLVANVVFFVLFVLAGVGLSYRAEWGRTVTFVAAGFNVLGIVFALALFLFAIITGAWTLMVGSIFGMAIGVGYHFLVFTTLAGHTPFKTTLSLFPMVAVGLCAGIFVLARIPTPQPQEDEFNYYEFGKLPLAYEGRVKPFDTFARNTLRVISGRESFVDENDQRQDAIRWMLDVIAKPDQAVKHKVFRIDNLEVLDTLGLKRRERFRYAIEEFRDKFPDFAEQVQQAREQFAEYKKTKKNRLTVYQKKLIELEGKLTRYGMIIRAFSSSEGVPSPPTMREMQENPQLAQFKTQQFAAAFRELHKATDKSGPPLAIPVADHRNPLLDPDEHWQSYPEGWSWALFEQNGGRRPNQAVIFLETIFHAYQKDDVKAFNEGVANYRKMLEENPPQTDGWTTVDMPDTDKQQRALEENPPEYLTVSKLDMESWFNRFSAFHVCIGMYIIAFLLAFVGILTWAFGSNQQIQRVAFWLIVLTLTVHTFALIMRIIISGRPPVTNLYSSAVFIGWACVFAGMVLEFVFRLGLGNIISSVAGFSTLFIANGLAADGDTLKVLVAVLDTQFWLSTHVICITLGYAATYLAGLFGLLYIIFGITSPLLAEKIGERWTMGKVISTIMYGTVCFAIFFSFVGTVLGGLWADDSWGRFWGWDPKENGALIIVFWNALVLHARWGGMIKDRGLAVMLLVGNIVTTWSWFAVNQLGIGLHSYGFTDGVLMAVGIFIAGHFLMMAVGLLPKNLWWSYRAEAQRRPEVIDAEQA